MKLCQCQTNILFVIFLVLFFLFLIHHGVIERKNTTATKKKKNEKVYNTGRKQYCAIVACLSITLRETISWKICVTSFFRT